MDHFHSVLEIGSCMHTILVLKHGRRTAQFYASELIEFDQFRNWFHETIYQYDDIRSGLVLFIYESGAHSMILISYSLEQRVS